MSEMQVETTIIFTNQTVNIKSFLLYFFCIHRIHMWTRVNWYEKNLSNLLKFKMHNLNPVIPLLRLYSIKHICEIATTHFICIHVSINIYIIYTHAYV